MKPETLLEAILAAMDGATFSLADVHNVRPMVHRTPPYHPSLPAHPRKCGLRCAVRCRDRDRRVAHAARAQLAHVRSAA